MPPAMEFVCHLSWTLCATCHIMCVPPVMEFVCHISYVCATCHGVCVHMSWSLCATCHGVCVPTVMDFVCHCHGILCATCHGVCVHLSWSLCATCHGGLCAPVMATCQLPTVATEPSCAYPLNPHRLPHASRDVRGKHRLEPNVKDRHPASSKSLSRLANPCLSSKRRCSGR